MQGVLAGRAVYALSDAELASAAIDIRDSIRILQAELISVTGEQAGRNIPYQHGFSSVPAWLNATHRVGITTASKMARLIKLLPAVPAVAEAFAAGTLSQAQAAEIATAADTVPAGVRDEAAKVLLGQAAALKPEELRVAGRRILRHVDPDRADEHDPKQLDREDRLAWDARAFTVSADGTGRYRLSGYTTGEGAAILKAALDPLCNPARTKPSPLDACSVDRATAFPAACECGIGATTSLPMAFAADLGGAGQAGAQRRACPNGCGDLSDTVRDMAGEPLPQAFRDPRSPAQRRHDGLLELVELALNTGELPGNGGSKAHIVITAPYDVTERAVRAGTLDTGEHLTPSAVRRLACDAGIIPSILDTHSVPLDLGRERRLIAGSLRRALILRDKGCAFPGCERPPKWCHAHHKDHWIDGGETSLENSVLVCGFHHRLIHQDEWQIAFASDGHPEFIPPAWLDPLQRPQRNLYHRRT